MSAFEAFTDALKDLPKKEIYAFTAIGIGILLIIIALVFM